MRTGGVEPPQREAAGLQPVELAGAQRPRELGWPNGLEPIPSGLTTPDAALHHGHHEAGTGTTGLEPAPSRLTNERSAQLSYAPEIARVGLNPRSRAHEAREDGPSSTALKTATPASPHGLQTASQATPQTPGGIRTRSFRIESPASSPFDHRGLVWPAGFETCIRPGYPKPGGCPSSLRPGVSRLRRQDSNLRLASNSRAFSPTRPRRNEERRQQDSNLRCLARLGHASWLGAEGEGVEPQGREAHPFSRRDTAPMAVLPGMAPAGVEPATSRLRGGCSAD